MCFSPFPLFQRPLVGIILNIRAVRFDRSIATPFNVLFTIPTSETPFLRGEDLLTTRELELGTSQSFDCSCFTVVLTTNGHQGLSDVDPGNRSLRFSVRSSHSGLEPSSFECFCRQLFILVRHKIHTFWKLIHAGLLLSQIKDSDLGVRHTTTETRFWVRFVLTVA